MKKLAILGAGGHGNVAADVAESMNYWSEIVFFDDEYEQKGNSTGWSVVGSGKMLKESYGLYHSVFVAIGNNAIRMQWLDALKQKGATVASLVHPSAVVSKHAAIGVGTIICPNAVVNINAMIGRGCILNTSAVVEHDCLLGDGVHLSPAAVLGGNVTVGQLSWVGIGAVVRHGIAIKSSTMIGAGAVVVSDVPNNATVVGNPARIR